MKLLLKDDHYNIVMNILNKYPYHFCAFGSRVKGSSRDLSDLDLCALENIPGSIMTHLEEDFEESDLPFKVDIIEWNKISESFRQLITKDLYALNNFTRQV